MFGIHRKNKKPEIKNIDQIIVGMQEVYEFKKVRVNNVMGYYGLNDEASSHMGQSQLLLSKTRRKCSEDLGI